MAEELHLDTETYSELNLKKVGTYRYAESAEVMLITYTMGDGPVVRWDHSTGEPPPPLHEYVMDTGAEVFAHKAMFDRNVLRLGNLRIDIPLERWRCTMVQAMQHALPGSLEDLGRVLGLPQDMQKLADGKKLIQKFCKPAAANRKVRRYDADNSPEEWERFCLYADQDTVALREIHRRLPSWNWKADDIALWHLDQRINDRGFAVDMELVRAGTAAAKKEKQELAGRFAALTGGLCPTQRDKVKAFINDTYGLGIDSTAKHITEPMAADESLPDELREIARIILAANKTSTAKYATMAEAVSSDGRFRGGLQLSGAMRTRRWAGRVFQPQNLPSRGLPKEEEVLAYIAALKLGVHDLFVDDLMLYGAAALRGIVVPEPTR